MLRVMAILQTDYIVYACNEYFRDIENKENYVLHSNQENNLYDGESIKFRGATISKSRRTLLMNLTAQVHNPREREKALSQSRTSSPNVLGAPTSQKCVDQNYHTILKDSRR